MSVVEVSEAIGVGTADDAIGQPLAGAALHKCRPCRADFVVRSIVDHLVVDAAEFAQMHRTGVARYLFRCSAQTASVGPGSYNWGTSLDTARWRRSPRWAVDQSKAARLGIVQKSPEEAHKDERISLRKNQAALFSGIFSPSSDAPSPRWIATTRSAACRREQVLSERNAAESTREVLAPMTFTAAHSHHKSTAAVAAEAKDVVVTTPRRAADAERPQSARRNPAVPQPPPTPEDRAESARRVLSRPSSASTKYGRGSHWADGAVQQCSIVGVPMLHPRDGKTDRFYDVDRGHTAVQPTPPGVSMGSNPRFAGDPPLLLPRRPTSGRTDQKAPISPRT